MLELKVWFGYLSRRFGSISRLLVWFGLDIGRLLWFGLYAGSGGLVCFVHCMYRCTPGGWFSSSGGSISTTIIPADQP